MPEFHYDTSAGRLASLLEDFCSRNEGGSAYEAWQDVLQVERGNDLLSVDRFGGVARLAAKIFEEVRTLPASEDPEFLLSEIEPLKILAAMFGSARMQNVGQVRNALGPTVVQGLKHCSRALRRSAVRSPVLQAEAVDRLLKDVGDWISEIASDGSLTVATKNLLTRKLLALQEALLGVRINGFDGVEDAISALVGTAATVPAAVNRSFLQRCWDFWRTAVGLAEGAQQLASAAEGAAKAIEAVSSIAGSS